MHHYLKVLMKDTTTLPLRQLPCPTHWPIIIGCRTSHHLKNVEGISYLLCLSRMASKFII